MATARDKMAQETVPVIFAGEPPKLSELRGEMNRYFLADETAVVKELLEIARLDDEKRSRIKQRAEELVRRVRKNSEGKGGIEAFLQQYDLSSKEGMVLMCLAEALIRVPDADTADRLIQDKMRDGKWKEHLGKSSSLFVNASTWGLMLTGKMLKLNERDEDNAGNIMDKAIQRIGEPMVRTAMRQAMRIMGFQFVMGRTIKEAMKRSTSKDHKLYRHSFDMLGEAALTYDDAEKYFRAYSDAIDAIGENMGEGFNVFSAPSISVKLSALHPRYEIARRDQVLEEMVPKLRALAERAKKHDIALTVDAEEADRLDISLDVIEAVYRSESLAGWEGFGLAIQSYQKRCLKQVDWLVALSREVGRRIPVRLVKGAYWDTEIKMFQVNGEHGYPVFTRKCNTDVSFLACARRMIEAGDALYPQFATHNAHTVSSILEMIGDRKDFEFQRLHGMGEELYGEIVPQDKLGIACRVYAPVGAHKELLPYLVRRLLENGANTSFVNRIVDEKVPVEDIASDPVKEVEKLESIPHTKIPLPRDIYTFAGYERLNSKGINMADIAELTQLKKDMEAAMGKQRIAAPIIGGKKLSGETQPSLDPIDNRRVVGEVIHAGEKEIKEAIDVAVKAQPKWDRKPATERAAILRKAADLYEEHMAEFMALCTREAGKSIADGVAEVREAVDFLRYYAMRCERDFGTVMEMPGPTGESNTLRLQGKGVFICISPWNFPLAIFTGQITAALAAGNAVISKPADQVCLIGSLAVELLHKAGVPGEVLNFLPCRGSVLGKHGVADERVAGVAFTGSTGTGKVINQTLANRDGIIPTLIAETGGQNAMIVDSSALPEQVVPDVVQSAFLSAGQRCSALRCLYVQEEIADRVIDVLAGYMKTMKVGDPGLLETDVGPVIDKAAQESLQKHADDMASKFKVVGKCELPEWTQHGTFVAPIAVEIPSLDEVADENFGPILHIVRYKAKDLDKVIEEVNRTGFGLTLGIHSRIDSEADYIQRKVQVGNAYVNRNQVGAVVGVQPFGGMGLSGTGPKAGGPHYMLRFANERTLTINTAAVGGNASLLSLAE
ncbi:MAG: bifunctional proline dehydrogenase/L-glutamate gamma-semialdehyde dehydrogenase PutA [Gammaproteobacteria bacterium]|nr:bifunctional proline dehydrogenase/L-glutamate gamma-semialdehyde dehydrogenase PutA [Gammaproteobacteria bacterium]